MERNRFAEFPGSDERSPPGESRPRLGDRLLRVPLFLKILLANALIAAVAGGAAILVTSRVAEVPVTPSLTATLVIFVVAVLVVSSLLNAVVVRLALSPLSSLAETAEKVKAGELGARVKPSRLADRATLHLTSLFNRMLDSLQAGRRRQRELARRVLEAEERERERIAHELYAGPSQTLAGVLIRLRLAQRRSAASKESCLHSEIRDEVALALDEIRALARRLHPPELGELGVRAALEAHARTLTEGRSIQVSFEGSVPEQELGPDAAYALFRITQEAITNAVRHSGGSRVEVRFLRRRDHVLTRVTDDGRGFETHRHRDTSPSALGLTGMRERASYAGGELEVESADDAGTTVRFRLPWSSDRVRARDMELDDDTGDLLLDDAGVRETARAAL